MTLQDQTLGVLAQELPGATAIFNRYKLSFCCGGDHTLKQAAEKAGIGLNEILAELAPLTEREAGPDTWQSAPTGALISHILDRFHKVHREQLPELIRLSARVEKVHGDKLACPTGLADHLRLMAAELENHMQKEEQVLFPMLLSPQAGMAVAPVRMMMREHDDHAHALKTIDLLTDGLVPPVDACNTWRALYAGLQAFKEDLEEHIQLENTVLFARVLGAGEV